MVYPLRATTHRAGALVRQDVQGSVQVSHSAEFSEMTLKYIETTGVDIDIDMIGLSKQSGVIVTYDTARKPAYTSHKFDQYCDEVRQSGADWLGLCRVYPEIAAYL